VVGVEDHAVDVVLAAAGADRRFERVEAQLGAQVIGHRPAQQPARTRVDHGGQVQPAFVGRDVGRVAAPERVEHRLVEATVDQISRQRRGRVPDGGAHLLASTTPDDQRDRVTLELRREPPAL
jgi:hypothetical protein